MTTKRLKKPCAECPFRRGGISGGADPTVYIGQAYGPFWLPCHLDEGYEGQGIVKINGVQQCAGAATFRANVGVSERMPPALHRLPADTETCFASPEQLLAHHCGISVLEASLRLLETPPERLLEIEVEKLKPTNFLPLEAV